MATLNFVDGSYTLGHLVKTVTSQAPELLLGWRKVAANLSGPSKIPGPMGVVLYLRMAQLMGCPVCRGVFPGVARSKGLTDEQIREALGGPQGFLDDELREVASYAEAVLQADGSTPALPTELLSPQRYEQIETFVRVSMVIHSFGLMLLPHFMIERARQR